jgi:hypothetical protein
LATVGKTRLVVVINESPLSQVELALKRSITYEAVFARDGFGRGFARGTPLGRGNSSGRGFSIGIRLESHKECQDGTNSQQRVASRS